MSRARDIANQGGGTYGSITADDLTVDTSTLVVDETNNRVGIGTDSPSEAVDIDSGNAATYVRLRNSTQNEGYLGYLSNGALTLWTDASAQAVTVDSDGNVGIGTSGPAGILQTREDTTGTSNIFFTNFDSTSGISTQEVAVNFNFNRSGGGVNLAAAKIVAGKEREWVGAASNQDGFLAFHTTLNETPAERGRFDSGGAFMVGTTARPSSGSNPGTFIEQTVITIGSSSSAAQDRMRFENPNGRVGKIECSGSSTSYLTTSDHRLKENVVDMTGAITRVKSLAPKRFNFIADDTTTVDGFLAHEAQTVVPESVTGTYNEVDSEGNPEYQGIDQAKLVPLLTGALQEAIAKIETLETTVTDLQTRVTALEAN